MALITRFYTLALQSRYISSPYSGPDMKSETPLLDPIFQAIASGQVGVALIDAALNVLWRRGRLSDWLPNEGAPACASPLLLNMEAGLDALKHSCGEIVLPSMRAGAEGARLTISIVWNNASRHFVVVTTPDHASDQIERLLAPERREKQLLQQQAAASAARARVADALYRDIVEHSGYFILRFGVDMRVTYANQLSAQFLGLPREALLGRRIDELFAPLAAVENPWRLGVAAERPASFELPAHDAQGALRWLGWTVRFLGADGGGEFQSVARDATASRLLRAERDKAREEAREAAIANERLRIAHDLHDTLVRSIVTMIAQTRLVAKTTTDLKTRDALREFEAQAREGLSEARNAITRMREARREENDLRAIVAEFALRAEEGGMTIETDWTHVSSELSFETEELFARVLREALRNIELHARATHVRVGLRKASGRAQLFIEDDGAGFDPLAPTPGHFGVSGMLERAKLAGAELEIDSAPGRGARMKVSAPTSIAGARTSG